MINSDIEYINEFKINIILEPLKMTVAALIQLIARPEDHERVTEVLLDLADNSYFYSGVEEFNVHYLSSNPGAYYVLVEYTTESHMSDYLGDFNNKNGFLIKYLLPYLIVNPIISQARMISKPSISSYYNTHKQKPAYQGFDQFIDNDQVTLIPFFYIHPNESDIEKVKQAHLSVITSTRNEPGCITYDLYQLLDDPAIMFFYENWTNEKVLFQHMNTPTFYRVVRGQVDPHLLVPWTALNMKIVV